MASPMPVAAGRSAATDAVIGPLATLIDALLPDAQARDEAKLALVRLQGTPALDEVMAAVAVAADARSTDPWTSRARPTFLYVMYALLLWSIPMGLIAAVRPDIAGAIGRGMTAYLNGLPEPLYTLFGTGYLGYTVARSWAKVKGGER